MAIFKFPLLLLFLSQAVAASPDASQIAATDNLRVASVLSRSTDCAFRKSISFSSRTILDDASLLPGIPRPVGDAALNRKADGWRRQSGIRFQENRGQIVDTDGNLRGDIAFFANAPGARLYFRTDGISYVFSRRTTDCLPSENGEIERGPIEICRVDMTLAGSNPLVHIRAEGELPGYVNYYLPHCPAGVTGVREYGRIVYENVYDDIDLELFSMSGRMKYNFVVRPGGNAGDIRMKYDGTTATAVTGEGALTIDTPLGSIEEAAPYSYAGDEQHAVPTRFLRTGSTVSFAVDRYDPDLTLVIDPWATYYGGSGGDTPIGIATDWSGNVVITGYTDSMDFPVTNSSTNSGSGDTFVVKFDSGGNVQWSTYYGGSGGDLSQGIATDGSGSAVVAGYTASSNLPVTNSSHRAGGTDAFILKLNSDGSVQWATYYGGNENDNGKGIATDGSGNVVITGFTESTNFPVTNSSTTAGGSDVFVLMFNGSGAVQWATYYGGSMPDIGYGVTADGSGNVVITGATYSTDFPVTNSSSNVGSYDAFVVKFNGSGAVQWATYYGGTGSDEGRGVAADGNGNIAIGGTTNSLDFPVTNATPNAGAHDAFVVLFTPGGTRQWARYYGGSSDESGFGIAMDGNGKIVMTGYTYSTNLPVTNSSKYAGGASDGYVVRFTVNGFVQWAIFFGGIDWENSNAVATYGEIVVITGRTVSDNLPVTNSSSYAAGTDGYVVHFDADGTFPVELVSFTARRGPGGEIHLRWSTETETNNLGYEVQRRSGDNTWESRGFVGSAGSSSQAHEYSFTDDPLPDRGSGTKWYFRLRQIDLDGTESFSPAVEVLEDERLVGFEILSLYPQPATNMAWVEIFFPEEQMFSFMLFDAQGRAVRRLIQIESLPPGLHAIAIDLDDVPDGLYYLRAEGKRTTAVRKILVGR